MACSADVMAINHIMLFASAATDRKPPLCFFSANFCQPDTKALVEQFVCAENVRASRIAADNLW